MPRTGTPSCVLGKNYEERLDKYNEKIQSDNSAFQIGIKQKFNINNTSKITGYN